MSLEHAQHNESLCDHLLADKRWNDWVVTTAFYAAVHYVEFKLFSDPLTIGTQSFENFDDYLHSSSYTNSHKARKNLVFQKIKKAHPAFSWLFDNCLTARYNSYMVDDETAKEAMKKLLVVRGCCASVEQLKKP